MDLALFIIAIVAVRVLYLNARPFGPCWLCHGKGVRKNKRRRKAFKCRLCHGKGRRQHLGSRSVHRVRRNIVEGWRAWRAER